MKSRFDGRDPRLDFFRGLALLVIYVAHIPKNPVAAHIPARYGWSDAADMFVFMSGFAAAIAYGGTFLRAGWFLGTARVAFRCWQLYWAQICLFMAIAGFSVWADQTFEQDYIGALNLYRFFEDTEQALLDMMLLSYVPNYFDILPMYMVILAMVPLVMLLARVHPLLPICVSFILWLCNLIFEFELLADRSIDRPWFFNPFAWQFIFFTGYSLARGWIQVPIENRQIFWAAMTVIGLGAAMKTPWIYESHPWLEALSIALFNMAGKTNYEPLRYLHFIAGAFVVVHLLLYREEILPKYFSWVMKCGQQSLAVFLFCMTLSRVSGVFLDQVGRSWESVLFVNAGGIVACCLLAYFMGWIKSQPWRRKAPVQEATSIPASVSADAVGRPATSSLLLR